jgi:hypothetical protein
MRTGLQLAFAAVAPAFLSAGTSAQLVTEGGTTYNVRLPENSVARSGYGYGNAVITVNPVQRRICYSIIFYPSGTATAAHLHKVALQIYDPGVRVATFSAPNDGDSAGCVDVTATLARQINANPGSYYVDVHTISATKWATREKLFGHFRQTAIP